MLLRAKHIGCLAAALALGVIGCAADIGDPDYSNQQGLFPAVNPFPPVPPDPFVPGESGPRLFVGYFYETGRTDSIFVNGVNNNYFIFALDETRPVDTALYVQSASADRVEGLISIEIALLDRPFWGGGIIWDDPIDLTEWTTMYVSFKSSDPAFSSFEITVQSGREEMADGFAVDPRDYGYQNDGEWHNLRIPLQDFIDLGWDRSAARSPFIIGGGGVGPEEILLVDNLYYTAE